MYLWYQFEKEHTILVSEQPIVEIQMLVKTVRLSDVIGYGFYYPREYQWRCIQAEW